MPHHRLQLSKRLFAWFSSHRNTTYEKWMEPRKRALFGTIRGTIAEIGAGAGPNLTYYPDDIKCIALEPNIFMHRYLKKEAERLWKKVDIRSNSAEKSALEDCSVDGVVGTLVLCSVKNQAEVLHEILRILRPGGTYYFIEHVAAPRNSFLWRTQRFLRPCWKFINDGCQPDRETLTLIQNCGFSHVEYESFRVTTPVVSPHIAGRAIK